MSETQVKITGTFQAADDFGHQHNITEYTIFRHTTTTDMALTEGESEVKEYKLGDGTAVAKISENEFEIVSDKIRLHRVG